MSYDLGFRVSNLGFREEHFKGFEGFWGCWNLGVITVTWGLAGGLII